jgi:hypothetical protein
MAIGYYNVAISDIRAELGSSSTDLYNLTIQAFGGGPYEMARFRGFSATPYYNVMQEYGGGLYDGCYMSLDHFMWAEGVDRNGTYFGPYGGPVVYNTERGSNNGTFLTFGGECYFYARANSTVTVTAYARGYGLNPCQPMYLYINEANQRRRSVYYYAGGGDVSLSYSYSYGAGGYGNPASGLGYGYG